MIKGKKNMTFSEKLIVVRAKLNLSQTDLGRLLHVSCITISRWETNKSKPTKKAIYAFEQLCKENNISFSEDQHNG